MAEGDDELKDIGDISDEEWETTSARTPRDVLPVIIASRPNFLPT